MPDLLNTSLTGMIAFQRALEVTGHNIANANTPGYSRQVVEFTTRPGQESAIGFIGTGTQIATVRRMYDALLGDQALNASTSQSRFAALNDLAGRIDTLLADPDTGMNSSLQSFFSSLQDLANDPASIPTRQALIGEADAIASRFAAIDDQLDALNTEVNGRLRLSVDEINRAAEAIANVNDKIALTNGVGQPPNDLLDERDRLVKSLSEHIAVSTTLQSDGSMSVFIGSGQNLVIGNSAQLLDVRGNEYDPTRLNVVYQGTAGTTPLNNNLTGGTLGGLLEFRSRMLDPAQQSLGQTAIAFAQSFNTQHSSGMDLRGNLGGDFFSVDAPTVLPSSANSGSSDGSVTVTDLGALTGANYVMRYDGAAWSMTREDTGTVIPMTGTGTAADPFVADGVEIEILGAPAAGDRMLIRTGQDAAGSIRNLIGDPQDIAMASPTRTIASLGNTGSAGISPTRIVDATDPGLLTSSVIEFTGPTTYTINGAGAFTYTDGAPITVNGSEVTITGAPAIGDQFTIEANFGATGDNSNGLQLADIQSVGLLDGGAISINQNYGRLVSDVGGSTHQIQASLDAQNVVLKNTEDALLAGSGVNLDEEATNLIRYQQAYQAAAQVVSITKNLFDTLLGATRR